MRFLAVFITLLAALPARADWLRLRGTHTELLTDAGEKEGLRALNRLEQIRAILPELGAMTAAASFAWCCSIRRRSSASTLRVETTAGLYQSGLEHDYIVTYAGGELPRVVTHEFVHFLLHQTPAPLPRWFEEGTAELYSNTQINNKRVRIGKEIEAHMNLLLARPWLTAKQLAAERPGGDPESGRSGTGGKHVLRGKLGAGAHAEPVAGLPRPHAAVRHVAGQRYGWIGSLPHGVRPRFRARAGRSAGRISKRFAASSWTFRHPRRLSPRRPSRYRKSTPTLLRADVALRRGLAKKARGLFEQAAREHPDSATAQAGLGMLAMTQNRPGDARRYLEKAIQLDDKDATILFEYALLERDAGAGNDRVRELLEKVVALNPNFGEAQLLLGVRATDDRSYDASHRRIFTTLPGFCRGSPTCGMHWRTRSRSSGTIPKRWTPRSARFARPRPTSRNTWRRRCGTRFAIRCQAKAPASGPRPLPARSFMQVVFVQTLICCW